MIAIANSSSLSEIILQPVIESIVLCWRCKRDLPAIVAFLQTKTCATNIFGTRSHWFYGIKPRTRCRLCKLLALLPSQDDFHAQSLWVVNLLGSEERPLAIDYSEAQYVMGLAHRSNWHRNQGKQAHDTNSRSYHQREGLVLLSGPKSDRSSTDIYGTRILDRARADFEAVQQWIEECCENHRKCTSSKQEALNLRVIDCDSEMILEKPPGAPYAALSYVWGSPKTVTQQQSRLSRQTTGRVVWDAIAVCKTLGYRYLWVDRFCIDQANEHEKTYTISKMDQIYESAVVTIVDAAGEDDNYGLPGAGTRPHVLRDAQPKARIGKYTFVHTLPNASDAIKGSKWSTRAWTYQETVLSTRCLIFTTKQVFLVCKTRSRCETLPRMPNLNAYPSTEMTLSNVCGADELGRRWARRFRGQDEKWSDPPLLVLEQQIDTYLQRQLTYDSDGLNAFRGVAARSELKSYWGIPFVVGKGCQIPYDTKDQSKVAAAVSAAFMRGLSWVPYYDDPWRHMVAPPRDPTVPVTTRRDSMPTWSWVSLKQTKICFKMCPHRASGKTYETYSKNQFALSTMDSCTEISIPDAGPRSESSQTIADLWNDSDSSVIAESHPYLHLRALVADVAEVTVDYIKNDQWQWKKTASLRFAMVEWLVEKSRMSANA
ncbi:hypothetical protein LQW54_005189 [Pestalotiopsis sp. IQ-011]